MYHIEKNPNADDYESITKAIQDNDGYCVCALEHKSSTKCICKDFREQTHSGFCHCGRYYKVYDSLVITLCGSTRFKDEFIKWNKLFTLQGYIVFSCAFFAHTDNDKLTPYNKRILDEVHKKKIEMSDMIFVLNRDGYIGESTRNEIEWAQELGKQIIYLEKNE